MQGNKKTIKEIAFEGREAIYKHIQKMIECADYGSKIRIITTEKGIVRMYKFRGKTYRKVIEENRVDLRIALPITKDNINCVQYFVEIGAQLRHLPEAAMYRFVNINATELISHFTSQDDTELDVKDDYGTWTINTESAKMAAIFFDSLWDKIETFYVRKRDLEFNIRDNRKKSSGRNNKAFIVHGHDEQLKNQLEAFLHRIGVYPVVLSREPDEGMTIIEKIEKHSDVGYAFILLTPDDVSYSASKRLIEESDPKEEMRARQNVIFEFGFFMGKLGRKGVCFLYKKGVSLPSDVYGMLYKEINNSIDEIKYEIVAELKKADYNISF